MSVEPQSMDSVPASTGAALPASTVTPPHRALLEEVDEYFEAGARVSAGDVVVDVGANVGAFAMRVAERTGGAVTIHCFEPAPATYASLRENVVKHPQLRRATTTTSLLALTRPDLAGNERPFYFFERIPTNSTYDLADKRAEYEAYFFGKAARFEALLAAWIPILGAFLGRILRRIVEAACRRDNRLGVWIADRATGLRVLTCKTESLERWADENEVKRIDLLKVDVEGAELDVLHGCGSKWPIIQSVAVEAHDRGGRVDAITALLRARGLTSIRRLKPKITESTGLDNIILVAHREERADGAGATHAEGSVPPTASLASLAAAR